MLRARLVQCVRELIQTGGLPDGLAGLEPYEANQVLVVLVRTPQVPHNVAATARLHPRRGVSNLRRQGEAQTKSA